MAGRVLRQDHFLSLAILNPKVIDAVDEIAPGYNPVASGGPIDLLAYDWDCSRILHQLGCEKRYHIKRAPEHMALPAGEKVARFYRVIHNRKLHVEIVFFGEDALVIGLEPRVCYDDWSPPRPHVDGKLHDNFAVLRRLRVIAYPGDRRNSGALDQRGCIGSGKQWNIRGRGLFLFVCEFLLQLGNVY